MLTYDRFNTHIGQLTVVKSERGVCFIGLPSVAMSRVQTWANRRFPGEFSRPIPTPFKQERQELQEYTSGSRTIFTFSLDHRNTPFSLQVLEEVRRVPYGVTASYADIARQVGHPHAARAVGRAVAANPLPLVIPCHRIVGSDGSLTGFGGGLSLKRELLLLESRGA